MGSAINDHDNTIDTLANDDGPHQGEAHRLTAGRRVAPRGADLRARLDYQSVPLTGSQ